MKVAYLVGLVWLAGLAGACNSTDSRSVSACEFNRSCTVDSDCVPVYEGTLGCCGPGCSNSAINTASYGAYQSAVAGREPTCSTAFPCAQLTDAICRSGAVCAGGTCQLKEIPADASSPD